MTSLEEVMARVAALKRDLEDLGVDVKVAAVGPARGGMKRPSVTVISLVLENIEEDLEAEGPGGV